MNTLTKEQNESLRRETLAVLATRPGIALTADGIRRRLVMTQALDFRADNDNVNAALDFLKGMVLVDYTTDSFGSTRSWQCTSDGILHYERNN